MSCPKGATSSKNSGGTQEDERLLGKHSRGGILTTEWCEGMRWEDWFPSASPSARSQFAELVWDFYWGNLITDGIMNADPHMGNFLFMPRATALIDFGCVKLVTPSFHTFFQATARAVYEGRWLDVWRQTVAAGLAVPTSEPDIIPRLWVWMLLPMLVGGPFRISATFLRGLLDTFSLPIVRKTANMSRDTIFLHQVQLATYSILSNVDVAVDYRSRFVARLYPNQDPPPPLSPAAFAPFGIDLDHSDGEMRLRERSVST